MDAAVTVGQTSVPLRSSDDGVRLGVDDAKVKADVWVDYSCPHCQEWEAATNTTIGQLVAAKTLQITYHNIQIVTSYGTEAGSVGACVAAKAPQQWWAVNAGLYANHSATTDAWQSDEFRNWARHLEVTDEDASTCISQQRYRTWISSNTRAAAEAGVQSTPTLFLNGKREPTTPSGTQFAQRVSDLAAG